MARRQLFTIEGLADLDQALLELPKATSRNVLKRVLTKNAQPIADAGTRYAPRSGRAGIKQPLAESYTVSAKLSRRQKSMLRKESDVEVYVGPAPSAKAIQTEFGNAHQSPQPHMRPAWDENVMKVLDNIGNDLADEIEKARARIARKAAREAARMNA